MKVYSLYGKSGTGKSYQAINLCGDLNIGAIIDDGLFICDNKVMAGMSAKREATKIGAAKTALFTDEKHRESVRRAIQKAKPDSILIIGTSSQMTDRIAEALELPPAELKIPIESITTEAERKEAKKQRKEMGKHVIPAPTFQLKHQFSGYFLYPVRMLRGLNMKSDSEKTVVRPTYSYLGDFDLSDKVITDIVQHLASKRQTISSVTRVFSKSRASGVGIDVALTMAKGSAAVAEAMAFQRDVEEQVEQMTAFNVDKVDVEIKGLK